MNNKVNESKIVEKYNNNILSKKKYTPQVVSNKIKNYTPNDKKNLINRIHKLKLNEQEMVHIFRIMADNDNIYTKNKNGIFFNLKNTTDSSLLLLEDYINILQNRKSNSSNSIENSTEEDGDNSKYSLLEYEKYL